MKIKNPPIIVLFDGISLTPNQGNQTQKIPPTTSVKDNSVNSAAGILFDPIEYSISPKHTKQPWIAKSPWFLLVDKKLRSLFKIITAENKAQIKPAIETVVNLGVSFLHLNETENIAKPKEEVKPNNSPDREAWL